MYTQLNEKKISVANLELGMQVVRLDRPWEETDFLLQGFVLQTKEDIEAVQRQCQYVFIEAKVQKQIHTEKNRRKDKQGLFARLFQKAEKTEKSVAKKEKAGKPKDKDKVTYINKIAIEKEIKSAETDYAYAKETVKSIMDGLRLGRALDLNTARKVVDNIIDSILRNSDALGWLTKLKNKDEYTAEHSLNVCILAATFAKHLGHEEADIRKIGLCGFLHDVGKSKIPLDVLNKPSRLNDEEFILMRRHPEFGRSLLTQLPKEHLSAVDVAFSHHERLDGKGYPRGLERHQIPYFAKVVSLADTYDAITSSRVYDTGRSSMEALDIIYKCKGTQFDEELALDFIKCIGIYPPGSIVELNSGEVALVLATNPESKLKPKVIIVLDQGKEFCPEQVIDLQLEKTNTSGKIYVISKELPNGSHGVDVREYIKKGLIFEKIHGNEDQLKDML